MALTFIGWSSWEVKLGMADQLALPPPMAWLPRTGIAAAQQQLQKVRRPCCAGCLGRMSADSSSKAWPDARALQQLSFWHQSV